MIVKIKDFIKNIVYSIIPPPFVQQYYSQAGEDIILQFLFKDYGKRTITYLDIGTNSPDHSNNTYLFYKNKSTGVCVEADETLIDIIKKVRPHDKVICAGVSVSDELEADFYVFDEPAISTFDKKEAEYRESFGRNRIQKIIKVPLVKVNSLIKDNFDTYPDLLSIDVEGLDKSILESLDFSKYPIPVICVETCTYSENHIRPKDLSISVFMLSKGYEVYADTYVNTIFVNKKWFYK